MLKILYRMSLSPQNIVTTKVDYIKGGKLWTTLSKQAKSPAVELMFAPTVHNTYQLMNTTRFPLAPVVQTMNL